MEWDLIPTANPNEKALQVFVDRGAVLSHLGRYTSGVTTLSAFELSAGPEAECGDWIYTYATKAAEGRLAFHFGKPKTDAEKRDPFDSRIERMGNHRWPDILVALGVSVDYSFPRSGTIIRGSTQGVITAPRYRIAEALVPEMNEGTRFLVQEFQAPTVFTIPRYRLPSATAVRLVLPDGSTYQNGECLHEEIELDPLPTAQTTLLSGSAAGAAGVMGGQLFPASNFTRWRPYWFSDEQVLRDGVWYRRRVRVIPPRVPDTIFQLN